MLLNECKSRCKAFSKVLVWQLGTSFAWLTHIFCSEHTIAFSSHKPKFDGKLLWFHSYKNFRKYNFCNDHVITKLTKILYYEKLELYGMLFTKTKYLKVAVSIEMQVLFKKNTIQP